MVVRNRWQLSRRRSGVVLIMAVVAVLARQSWVGAEQSPVSHQVPIITESGKSIPKYRIYPLRNGRCEIAGHDAFEGGDPGQSHEYVLYVWLILGGDKPILVDAGLNDVAEMNRGAAAVLKKPITQEPTETVAAQLARFGLRPADIGHVFITHLHFDHVDGLDAFTNARIYIGKQEWQLATANDCKGSWGHGRIMFMLRDKPEWNKRLVLVEDEEVLPGIESFFVGGHTLGSMAYRINTTHGRAVLAGDTVSLLANIEKDIPVGVRMDLEQCKAGMKKIRERADIILPSHDPTTPDRWPPVAPGSPRYTIRAIKVGQCEVREYISFQDSQGEDTRTYNLYVWVVLGGPHPILVETGPNPKYVGDFNKATARYIPGGVKQLPEEDTLVALKRADIDPSDVGHVIVTHLHADHYDYFAAFPNAKLVISRREYEEARHGADDPEDRGHLNPEVFAAIRSHPQKLILAEDQEILSGIRTVPLGCHTPGSQGVLVQTYAGPVMLTGDVVYLYENIEQDRPTRSLDPRVCQEAMAKIRTLADIVLPAHDPLTLVRWPGGVIGAKPGSVATRQAAK
ncbi:MAG: N-acyl homoserine lactonase family protein [Phycisphaerae bacterium]